MNRPTDFQYSANRGGGLAPRLTFRCLLEEWLFFTKVSCYMCCAPVGRRAIGQTHMFFTIQTWRHLSEQRLVFFSSGIWFVAFCLNFCFISTRILVQVCVANCIDIHPRGLRMHASQCPSLCCTNKPPATAVPYVFMFPVMFPLNISAVVH